MKLLKKEYRYITMHGQQNVKIKKLVICLLNCIHTTSTHIHTTSSLST